MIHRIHQILDTAPDFASGPQIKKGQANLIHSLDSFVLKTESN